jgi:adenylate cyclase
VARRLSLQGLAEETDSDRALLTRLTEIGVLATTPDGEYVAGDIIRVEAARAFLDAGLTIEDIETALETGLFTFEFLDRFHPEPASRSGRTLGEAASIYGIEPEMLASIYLSMGLPEPHPDQPLRTDEEAILAAFVDTWGVDSEALLRAARLIGEPARVVSDGWARLFVEKISEPLVAQERPVEERIATIAEATEKATSLAPRMLQWLLQRHMRHAIDKVNIEGFEQTMAEQGMALPVPARLPAIAFVDVSGYTSMTEREGDELAVRTSETIRERALRATRAHHGTVVKILGDGAMLHFPDVVDALVAVAGLVAELTGEGVPVHAGLHAGSLIEHDGDYYGRTVNLAARVAGVAGPGQIMVTQDVVDAFGDDGFSFDPVAPAGLKGIAGPVSLYLAIPVERS